ncbi:Sodium/glucose cotransporter 4 [Armadillidium vulgare]|nr:Sodium/glucose cotransporter 4 [Armadillidium vulgare]
MMHTLNIQWPDMLVIAGYFAFVLAVGLIVYASKKSKVGLHYSPVISVRDTLSAWQAQERIGYWNRRFELNAVFVLLTLGWLFLPVYMSSGIYTMPEYLRERFGGQRIRADLYAGALFIQESLGKTHCCYIYHCWWTCGCNMDRFCADNLDDRWSIYFNAFYKAGGYEAVTENYFYAIPENVSDQYADCIKPPAYAMDLFRPIAPGASDLPWTGMVIVQRSLASKDMIHAKAGCVLAGFLKFFPMFLLVFPGMCSRILFPNQVACAEPEKCKAICGSETGCTNIAYIKLVLELLPTGLRGLMLAVMMAALMSSLTSIFNSSSTIFTIDIWERFRRKSWRKMNARTVEIEKLIVGRLFVLVLVFISVVWIPVIQNSSSSQLFVYIQSISSFLSPPICAVYVLAIFWSRTNEPGAFWGLMIGLIIGIIRFIMEFSYVIPPCGSGKPDPRPEFIKLIVGNVHYLHFGILLFFITLILYRLTFWTRFSDQPRVSIRQWRNETDDLAISNGKAKLEEPLEELDETKSCGWLMLYKLCGFSSALEKKAGENIPDKTPEELAKDASEFMVEDEKRARIVNGFALLAMVMAAFVWAFYA